MKEIETKGLWGENILFKDKKLKASAIVILHSHFKRKFQILAEDLIKKANKIGVQPTININIKYEDLNERNRS